MGWGWWASHAMHGWLLLFPTPSPNTHTHSQIRIANPKSWFSNCCVFRPAFGCWSNYIFSRFQPFLLILNLFQGFHAWNHWKTSENEHFFQFFLLLKAGKHANDSLRGYLKFVFFRLIFYNFWWSLVKFKPNWQMELCW